jgi:DNA-binding NarL/FixJ family response regulator
LSSTTESEARADHDPARAVSALEWPIRVLIVDDAASTRRLLRGVLEYSPRFDVAGEADNGLSAIVEATSLQPDVILLDVSMPFLDGLGALADLLRVAPRARIVVVSGADEKAAARLVAAGALAFIPKGLPPLELLKRLVAVLGMPSVEPDHGSATSGLTPTSDAWRPVPPGAVICDDDPTTRRLVTQVMESCGVDVIAETDNVPNLLSVLQLARPEFVILDLWLEGISGTSALPDCHRISPASLVVVYSAHELWRGNALAAGAVAFVAKPHFDKLTAEIRRLAPVFRPAL